MKFVCILVGLVLVVLQCVNAYSVSSTSSSVSSGGNIVSRQSQTGDDGLVYLTTITGNEGDPNLYVNQAVIGQDYDLNDVDQYGVY